MRPLTLVSSIDNGHILQADLEHKLCVYVSSPCVLSIYCIETEEEKDKASFSPVFSSLTNLIFHEHVQINEAQKFCFTLPAITPSLKTYTLFFHARPIGRKEYPLAYTLYQNLKLQQAERTKLTGKDNFYSYVNESEACLLVKNLRFGEVFLWVHSALIMKNPQIKPLSESLAEGKTKYVTSEMLAYLQAHASQFSLSFLRPYAKERRIVWADILSQGIQHFSPALISFIYHFLKNEEEQALHLYLLEPYEREDSIAYSSKTFSSQENSSVSFPNTQQNYTIYQWLLDETQKNTYSTILEDMSVRAYFCFFSKEHLVTLEQDKPYWKRFKDFFESTLHFPQKTFISASLDSNTFIGRYEYPSKNYHGFWIQVLPYTSHVKHKNFDLHNAYMLSFIYQEDKLAFIPSYDFPQRANREGVSLEKREEAFLYYLGERLAIQVLASYHPRYRDQSLVFLREIHQGRNEGELKLYFSSDLDEDHLEGFCLGEKSSYLRPAHAYWSKQGSCLYLSHPDIKIAEACSYAYTKHFCQEASHSRKGAILLPFSTAALERIIEKQVWQTAGVKQSYVIFSAESQGVRGLLQEAPCFRLGSRCEYIDSSPFFSSDPKKYSRNFIYKKERKYDERKIRYLLQHNHYDKRTWGLEIPLFQLAGPYFYPQSPRLFPYRHLQIHIKNDDHRDKIILLHSSNEFWTEDHILKALEDEKEIFSMITGFLPRSKLYSKAGSKQAHILKASEAYQSFIFPLTERMLQQNNFTLYIIDVAQVSLSQEDHGSVCIGAMDLFLQ